MHPCPVMSMSLNAADALLHDVKVDQTAKLTGSADHHRRIKKKGKDPATFQEKKNYKERETKKRVDEKMKSCL